MQVGVKSGLVPMYCRLTSNPSLLGLVDYQATLELDNIPEIDVDEQKQRLEEDKLIALVFCYEYFLQNIRIETYLSR